MSTEWGRIQNKFAKGLNVSNQDLMEFTTKAENNILFFAKYFCNRILTPKQALAAKYLREEQNFVGVFNRQGGKTEIISIYDTHELAFRRYPDGHRDLTIIFAPIKEQSRLIFGRVESFLKDNPFLWSMIEKHQSGGLIKMRNGNELQAKTASPQAHIRGHSPTKIQCDETQDITDLKYYEDIIPSGAATNAKIQEIGTPAKRNHFYKTYHHDGSFKRVKQTWEECPFIAKDYIMNLLESGKMTKARFDQEFNCIWNVDAGAAFSYDLIATMCNLKYERQPPEANFRYYAGIDVGKKPAETVLSIGKGLGDQIFQVFLLRITKPPSFNYILNELYKPLSLYEPLTCIDATTGSQGAVLYDMIVQKFRDDGNHNMAEKIIPADYNSKNTFKAELANDVELLGENNNLKLFNETTQRRQLVAYEKRVTPSGMTVYYSEELSDVVQAVQLMVRSFKHYGDMVYGKFHFAASGGYGGASQGGSMPSFINSMPKGRPDW